MFRGSACLTRKRRPHRWGRPNHVAGLIEPRCYRSIADPHAAPTGSITRVHVHAAPACGGDANADDTEADADTPASASDEPTAAAANNASAAAASDTASRRSGGPKPDGDTDDGRTDEQHL